MKPHVRNGRRAKARRVEDATKRLSGQNAGAIQATDTRKGTTLDQPAPPAQTLVDCDCEVKEMRPADKRATGGNDAKGY